MTNQQKQDKIIAAIASRGWFTCDIYLAEARKLEIAGAIKRAWRYTTGGNQKPVWVTAA